MQNRTFYRGLSVILALLVLAARLPDAVVSGPHGQHYDAGGVALPVIYVIVLLLCVCRGRHVTQGIGLGILFLLIFL